MIMYSDRTMTDLYSLRNLIKTFLKDHPQSLHKMQNRFVWYWHRQFFSQTKQKCVIKGLCLIRNFITSSLHCIIYLHSICTKISTSISLYIFLSQNNLKRRHRRGEIEPTRWEEAEHPYKKDPGFSQGCVG